MYFLYCRECENIRPRGWIIFTKRCEMCRGTMDKIKVKMTPVAPFYYASLVAMLVILVAYMDNWGLPFGVMPVLFVSAVAIILAFVDYSISYRYVIALLEKEVAPKKS